MAFACRVQRPHCHAARPCEKVCSLGRSAGLIGKAYVGVDVGTRSARAGIFDDSGQLLASAKRPIAIWHEAGEIVEHSSKDIWAAATGAVREAVRTSGLPPDDFGGIGFDATCSLVVLDAAGGSLAVGPSGSPERDTIVWMDHRAMRETDAINAGGHDVLRYVGGKISPEMQAPKLAWLARHMPQTFARAAHFFDLTDFLTWRASGDATRSICTITCKWTYLAHERRWDGDFFEAIGLGALKSDGFKRIGANVAPPGAPIGQGLTRESAAEMDLPPGLPVGAGLIDAHAGAVGTLGAGLNGARVDPLRRMALILGTSACCMALADRPRFINGVWGPYYSALTAQHWLTEGGQSAFGAAIDHLMQMHPRFAEVQSKTGGAAFEHMERDILAQAGDFSRAALLAGDQHVLPDFLGNRSPHADSNARGVLAGLDLRDNYASLLQFYVAGLTGLAHGLAQIIRTLEAGGYDFDRLVVSGGAARSALVRQLIADASGRIVSAPQTSEPVLLGAAMLGAVAAGRQTMETAMSGMSKLAGQSTPQYGEIAAFHSRKRRAFEAIQQAEQQVRALMQA
jgi:D-ribulokinase